MKICPTCNNQVDDNAVFCTNCGTQFVVAQQPSYNQQTAYEVPQQPNYVPTLDQYDHTAEFDAQDISDNKIFAMLVYLMGSIGIIIALLASGTSKYTMFHIKQALKFTIVETLSAVITLVLSWTVIVPFAYFIFITILAVIRYICFFQVCSGNAKEPAIIRSLGFLR